MARTPVHEVRVGPRDGEERLQRKRKSFVDAYHIDPALIPPGTSYEWKRENVYGQENPAYMMGLQENHWKPVDASRLPHMMPEGYKGAIRRDGLILMERPSYLTEEAEQENIEAARAPVLAQKARMGQTPDGTAPRVGARVAVTYDEIPE